MEQPPGGEPQASQPARKAGRPKSSALADLRAFCEKSGCGVVEGDRFRCLRCVKPDGSSIVVSSNGGKEGWVKGTTHLFQHFVDSGNTNHFSDTDIVCDAGQLFPDLWHEYTCSETWVEQMASRIATLVSQPGPPSPLAAHRVCPHALDLLDTCVDVCVCVWLQVRQKCKRQSSLARLPATVMVRAADMLNISLPEMAEVCMPARPT